MVLPLLIQSLTGRELDSYLTSVELDRAVHKVRMVLPLLVQSLTGTESRTLRYPEQLFTK
jgi:hypothetical protein